MNKLFFLSAFVLLIAVSSIACTSAPSGAEASYTAEAISTGSTNNTESIGRTDADFPTAGPATTPHTQNEGVFYVMDFNDVYATTGMQQIIETKDCVYYLCSVTADTSIVYFSDKEYKDWMPLCSKPDCLHGPKDVNCNAHLEGETFTKMWLYGDHIYYCSYLRGESELSLWRMKLDGLDHEKLLILSESAGSSLGWFFHNKYLFLSSVSVVGENAETQSSTYIVDLSAAPIKSVKIDLVDETGNSVDFRLPIIGCGDKLYCLSNDGENYVYCVDISNAVRTTVCQLPADPGLASTALYDDTLYFCLAWDYGGIITVDVNTGEQTVLNKAEPQTVKWYLPYKRFIFGSNTSKSINPDLKGTAVYDYDGELIKDIPYESYNTDINISYIIGNYVFGYDHCEGGEFVTAPPTWYLDLRDIGTDNLMWRKWEPEG